MVSWEEWYVYSRDTAVEQEYTRTLGFTYYLGDLECKVRLPWRRKLMILSPMLPQTNMEPDVASFAVKFLQGPPLPKYICNMIRLSVPLLKALHGAA